jgi:hypothetical protein
MDAWDSRRDPIHPGDNEICSFASIGIKAFGSPVLNNPNLTLFFNQELCNISHSGNRSVTYFAISINLLKLPFSRIIIHRYFFNTHLYIICGKSGHLIVFFPGKFIQPVSLHYWHPFCLHSVLVFEFFTFRSRE